MALSIKTKTLVALFHSGLVKESSTVDNKGHKLNMTGNKYITYYNCKHYSTDRTFSPPVGV